MRFKTIRLRDFRNIQFAELAFEGDRIFLCGPNGQGKSNLLEALGMPTALRSFRTQDASALVRQGSAGYAGVYDVEHEHAGTVSLELRLEEGRRKLLVDGERVTRLGDFVGRFPVVPLSSGDLMLLRGSPGERRRFMDMTFASLSGDYYEALRKYQKGVTDRNRLLKNGGSDAELSAFESEMANYACLIHVERRAGMAALCETLKATYAAFAEGEEGPMLSYLANSQKESAQAYQINWERERTRDRIIGATQSGPHRDDFKLELKVGAAKEYGSDGQQRGLIVALRIAQAQLFYERLKTVPVLLVDDILGELDPKRRKGFWAACPQPFQIIASGTVLPDESDDWIIYTVEAGSFTLQKP